MEDKHCLPILPLPTSSPGSRQRPRHGVHVDGTGVESHCRWLQPVRAGQVPRQLPAVAAVGRVRRLSDVAGPEPERHRPAAGGQVSIRRRHLTVAPPSPDWSGELDGMTGASAALARRWLT